jgi:hypothetical protein
VKHHHVVHIVTRKHLSDAMQAYPEAANEIKSWVAIVKGVRWHNFAEVRLMFRDADYVNGYMVFNIRRNVECQRARASRSDTERSDDRIGERALPLLECDPLYCAG